MITGSGANGVPQPIQITYNKVLKTNYIDPLGLAEQTGMIFDPSTQQTVVCNTAASFKPTCTNGQTYQVRSQYPNNQIPVTQFDPVALKVLNLVPSPKGANAASGQLGANLPEHLDQLIAFPICRR